MRIGVRVRVRVSVGLTVTSCGLPMTTPSATKTEPMMARFVGVPLALMNEKRPPPCRSEPVATCVTPQGVQWAARYGHSDQTGQCVSQRELREARVRACVFRVGMERDGAQCTVFAALTAVIRDHPMNISGLVPHRATVGLAVATVARAAGDTTRPCAGANARRRRVAATRIVGKCEELLGTGEKTADLFGRPKCFKTAIHLD